MLSGRGVFKLQRERGILPPQTFVTSSRSVSVAEREQLEQRLFRLFTTLLA